jgi:TPR repeat protein
MRKKLMIAMLIAGSAVGFQANAGPYDDATAAYKRGDYATALKLIRPIAEQGNLAAEYNLATMYYNGEGARRDYAEAMKWFRQAADKGDIASQRYLGFMYAEGQGVPSNDVESFKWYGRAAEQGDADAANNLGVMYSDGRGAPKDLVEAHKWFALAAMRYPASEQKNRDTAQKNVDKLAKKMTPAEIAQAQKLAREWKPKARRAPQG